MTVLSGDPQYPKQEMPLAERQKIFYSISDETWQNYKDFRFVAIAVASRKIIAYGDDYRMVGDKATPLGETFILAISKFYHDQEPVDPLEMAWPTETELCDIRSALRQISENFKMENEGNGSD